MKDAGGIQTPNAKSLVYLFFCSYKQAIQAIRALVTLTGSNLEDGSFRGDRVKLQVQDTTRYVDP